MKKKATPNIGFNHTDMMWLQTEENDRTFSEASSQTFDKKRDSWNCDFDRMLLLFP